jgi:aldose 1-epimerase
MALTQQKQGIEGIESPDGSLELEFSAGTGGSITAFRHRKGSRTFDLFRAYDPDLPLTPLDAASFPLTPYSNRIINGKLTVAGKNYDIGPLHAPEPHQLHGDGWLLPWTVAASDRHRVTLALKTEKSSRTPYAYKAAQTLTLTNACLRIDMEITNLSGITLPFGLGHHPYFNRNDKTVLKALLPKVWTSHNIVPEKLIDVPARWNFTDGLALSEEHFGPPHEGVQGHDLMDHCFQGWDQRAEIIWPDKGIKLTMTADSIFEDFVIYIPSGKPFFCAEPVTHVIDAFNLHEKGIANTGTIFLKDGETLKAGMTFEPAPA